MAKKENNKAEIVVVKGVGVVEIIENMLEGFVKIETQGMSYEGGAKKPTKVIIFMERDDCEILFN